jgi:enoyl-CoA hydratase/carnithine racemase
MTDIVKYEQDGHVVTLTLNDPENRNPVSDMIDELCAAIECMDRDNDVRVGIITGAGRAFSSGGNVKKMADRSGGGLAHHSPAMTRAYYRHGIQRIPMTIEKAEVPLIAAVNGAAVGAGCDLTCMCDIRIAGESAKFAESFVKVGIVPGDGGAFLLPRVVGFAKAAEMSLTGDMLTAQEALACGLVSKVVPDDQLMVEARKIAAKIAANSPHAVRMTRRLLRESQGLGLAAILDLSAAYQALAHSTDDHKEALLAQREKRAGVFKGH